MLCSSKLHQFKPAPSHVTLWTPDFLTALLVIKTLSLYFTDLVWPIGFSYHRSLRGDACGSMPFYHLRKKNIGH